jgi:hypothetical protein
VIALPATGHVQAVKNAVVAQMMEMHAIIILIARVQAPYAKRHA